jgi:hypothetical protein
MPYLNLAGEMFSENFAFQKHKFMNCVINSAEDNKDLTWDFNYLTSFLYNTKHFLHKSMNKIPEDKCKYIILLSNRTSLICHFRCLHSPTLSNREN